MGKKETELPEEKPEHITEETVVNQENEENETVNQQRLSPNSRP